MSNALFNSLGLNNVEADPNKVPDDVYDGEIMKSELALVPAKARISHVLTYVVTSGPKKGAQKQEWYELAANPVDESGAPATKLADVRRATPSMTEQAKPWYKKRLVDCGAIEQEIDNGTFDISTLVGTPVTFGMKTNAEGFQNVSFARKRVAAPEAAPAPVSLADLGAAPAPVAAPVAETTPAPAVTEPQVITQEAVATIPVGLAPEPVAPQSTVVSGL